MEREHRPDFDISEGLLEVIRAFPVQRAVEHCGARFIAAPFDFYADCPRCGARIKVRSFSGVAEIEDVFDAVFEWMNRPKAQDEARRRQMVLKEEAESAARPQDQSESIIADVH
jgi:hypothetical protein